MRKQFFDEPQVQTIVSKNIINVTIIYIVTLLYLVFLSITILTDYVYFFLLD